LRKFLYPFESYYSTFPVTLEEISKEKMKLAKQIRDCIQKANWGTFG